MNIRDFFKAPQIKRENEELIFQNEKLKTLFEKINATEAIEIQNKINDLKQEKESLMTNIDQYKNEINDLSNIIFEKKNEIIMLDEELLLESFSLYKPKFNFLTSDEYKNRLNEIRNEQKQMVKSGTAAIGSQGWTVNNNKSQGKKMVNDMIKLVLRSFNNECDYCVDNVKFNNIESSEKRIEKSFDTLNKLGSIMHVFINSTYKKFKLDELYLAFEYQQKKQEEKEELKRIREEQREQQKLEQEIKLAREKIIKERKHFKTAIKDLESRLTITPDEKEKESIVEKINQMNTQLGELDKEEKVIDYREQNAKAGYVYVISNIGAFGENVYKIGMTRRLEPMDRVDELGDASVPFSFDVHAMIFSDNAPDLESKIHQHFYNNRINKLNNRKEFFRADIYEIEKVIKNNFDNIVDVVKQAPAEQYRESLLIK
jgi:predicted  nucleic acid-binding Zn-ribbon protein